jgi:hypothetical protein
MTASSLRVVNFSTIVFFLFLSLSLLWGGRNCFRVTTRDFQIFLGFFYLGIFFSFSSTLQFIPKKDRERTPTHTLSPLSLSLLQPRSQGPAARRVWLTHVSGCLPCDIITSSSCCLPRKKGEERRYFGDDNNSEKTFLSAWLTSGGKTQIGGSWAHDSDVVCIRRARKQKNSLNLR